MTVISLKEKFSDTRGISLLLTVVVLSLVLSISLGIFNIIYNELLISGDIRSSFLALYAADEVVERTAYLDRNLHKLCSSFVDTGCSGNACFCRPPVQTSNGGCGSVNVIKDKTTTLNTTTGTGQSPGGASCLVTSATVKRAFQYKYPMPEMEDLMAWWSLDEGNGQDVHDSTPFNNHGYLGTDGSFEGVKEPSWTATALDGEALLFNETNEQYVRIPNYIFINFQTFSPLISITAWVCNRSLLSHPETIVRKGTNKDQPGFLETYDWYIVPGGEMVFKFTKDNGASYYSATSSGAAIPLNIWTHLAVTYDGSNVRFYRNNNNPFPFAQTISLVAPGSFDSVPNGLFFGYDSRNIGAGTRAFSGILDEIKIFNRILNTNEIHREYTFLLNASEQPRLLGGWSCIN